MTNILLLKSQSEETKSASDDPYVSKLADSNFQVRLVYSLDFQFFNLNELSESLKTPANYSGIIFTSPRCVSAVFECLQSKPLPHEWEFKKVFVVSETTNRLVQSKLNILNTIGSAAGNEDALIPIIHKGMEPGSKPLLLPVGSLSSKKIFESLKEKEIIVEEIPVYKTVPHPALKEQMDEIMERSIPHIIVFFSPSGIQFTKPFMTQECIKKVKFVAIGPTTERALKDAGLHVASTSAKPNPECLLDAINLAMNQGS